MKLYEKKQKKQNKKSDHEVKIRCVGLVSSATLAKGPFIGVKPFSLRHRVVLPSSNYGILFLAPHAKRVKSITRQ